MANGIHTELLLLKLQCFYVYRVSKEKSIKVKVKFIIIILYCQLLL